MKLYFSPTSPFARIVHVAALEKGVKDRIEFVPARDPGANLDKLNPLDKIPTLVTDDGETLIESRLIALYVDGLGTHRLYPEDPAARRRVLQQEAIILGVMDAAGLRRQEARRDDAEQSEWWIGRQMQKYQRGLDKIENELDSFTANETIVPFELCIALEYIDRFVENLPEFEWRTMHPKMTAWQAEFREMPSLVATRAPGD
jgi:glutathione S-transferase